MSSERKRLLIANGSLLHERLISLSNGRYNPFRIFSADELKRATNNNDPQCIFAHDGLGLWYKGSLGGRDVSICIAEDQDSRHKSCDATIKQFVNDVAVAAQVSGHKNVLKLIGCCLETQIPILVYESVESGSLYDRIYPISVAHSEAAPWKYRLRIATEIAHAIAYLHTAFPRPIIHRGINIVNIFLDDHNIAKLSNFSQSIDIRYGETHKASTVVGIIGYLPPEYLECGEVTEKFDVYSYGTLLLELLTGRRPHNRIARKVGYFKFWMNRMEGHFAGNCLKYYVECHSIDEVVDRALLEEGGGINEQQQWQDVVELALTCLETAKEKRPTMVEVTKQLWLIERCFTPAPERQRAIFENGRLFMEELIASCDGRCNTLQSFSASELKKATNDYSPDSIFCCSNLGIWYKGNLGNGLFLSVCKINRAKWREHAKVELKIAEQLSTCKNVLKILGCCLETPVPTLVYEPAENGTLFSHIHFPFFSLSWSSRLKIAKQIADEVADLHSIFSTHISMNMKSANIFLDTHNVPKLSNFSEIISMNKGEPLTIFQIEGTKAYMPPEYYNEGIVTEKADVYSFGVLLIELLIGSKLFDLFHFVDKQGELLLDHLKFLFKPQCIKEVVDPRILTDLILADEANGNEKRQWEAVRELAFRCMKTVKEERPTMIEVAAELQQIL